MKYFQIETDVTYMIWAENEDAASSIVLEALKKGLASLGIDWTMTPRIKKVTDTGLEKNGTRENEVKKDKKG